MTKMTLDIGSGSSRPYVKYNAKAGRWYINGENGDVEIQPPTFIIDFDNIVSGWFLFREGQAPDRALDPAMGTRAQQPTPDHKRGFVVMCNSPKYFGGTVEMSSSSMHLCNSIKDAYEAYEDGRGANIGKVPVFACTGITPSRDKFGQNFRPTLQLVKWVDRSHELPDEPAAMDRPQPPPRPATAARPSPPPRVPATVDMETAEF
jgi:hypothetical protein